MRYVCTQVMVGCDHVPRNLSQGMQAQMQRNSESQTPVKNHYTYTCQTNNIIKVVVVVGHTDGQKEILSPDFFAQFREAQG